MIYTLSVAVFLLIGQKLRRFVSGCLFNCTPLFIVGWAVVPFKNIPKGHQYYFLYIQVLVFLFNAILPIKVVCL